MKVAHVCLSCFFIDGRSYQENELVSQHVRDGHEVLVLASTETHAPDGKITYTQPGEYTGTEGASVRRLAYRRFLPHKLMSKLRMNVGTYEALARFRPEVILFHGTCAWELRVVARYARRNPTVLLYVDSHEDWNNSARSFISREVLHRCYYGPVLRSVLSQIRKILCVSTESMDFVNTLYRVPRPYLEFFPLGGRPVPDEEYEKRRLATRLAHKLAEEDILLVQSGKQTKRKKLLESFRALAACQNPRLRLLVVGVLHSDIRVEADRLIAGDPRVRYLGWKSTDELTDLLCAADVYLQPGTQSVTMQHSLCARCAVILDDVPAHQVYLRDNGWLISKEKSLETILADLGNADLAAMQRNAFLVAKELLDYSILSRRVLL